MGKQLHFVVCELAPGLDWPAPVSAALLAHRFSAQPPCSSAVAEECSSVVDVAAVATAAFVGKIAWLVGVGFG